MKSCNATNAAVSAALCGLFLAALPAAADIVIDEFTIVIDQPVTSPVDGNQDDVVVLEGGSVTTTADFEQPAITAGRGLDIRGGTVSAQGLGSWGVSAFGPNTHIRGGLIETTGDEGDALAVNNGNLKISGGTIRNTGRLATTVDVSNGVYFQMTGGRIETQGNDSTGLFLANQSESVISGGTLDVTGDGSFAAVRTFGSSTLHVSGGVIQNSAESIYDDNGSIVVSPPTAAISASESSEVFITGGRLDVSNSTSAVAVQAFSTSRVTITGGEIESTATTADPSNIAFDLFAGGDSVITLIVQAQGLRVNGELVDFDGANSVDLDELVADFTGSQAVTAVIEGFYEDGQSFSLTAGNESLFGSISSIGGGGDGTIRLLVPEPSAGLAFCGLVLAAARRRTRKKAV